MSGVAFRDADSAPTEAPVATIAAVRSGAGLSRLRLHVDLLVYILGFVGATDLASWQLVSRAFRDVVKASLFLQYKIECFLFGVEDFVNAALTTKESLDNIRSWHNACKTLRWTDRVESTMEAEIIPKIWTAFGSGYAHLEANRLTVVQPGSKYRGVPQRERAVDILATFNLVVDFAYDDTNQLLAVVEYDKHLTAYNIHLYSTVMGDKHPLAFNTLIRIQTPDRRAIRDPDLDYVNLDHDTLNNEGRWASVTICDSVLAFKASAQAYYFSFSEIWVWNWKSGEVLLNMYGDATSVNVDDVVLVDSSYCLTSFEDYGEEHRNGVAVFKLSTARPARRDYYSALQTDALLLILLPDVIYDCHNYTRVMTGVSLSYPATREAYFRRRDEYRLLKVLFCIEMRDGEEFEFGFLTHLKTIYSLLSTCVTGDAPRVVPWSEWAQDARVFNRLPYCEEWVFGAWYAVGFQGSETWSDALRVHDFSPLGAASRGRATEDEGNDGLDAGVVTKAFKIACPRLWKTPISGGQRLPYRKTDVNVWWEFSDIVSLGEDYLMVMRTEDEGMRRILYTL